MNEKSYVIKRGLWDSKPRKLIFNCNYFEFEDKIVGEDKPTRINKTDIKEFRYGIVWIRGLEFYIGRQYQIHIKTTDNKVLTIDFLTYYGINKKELNKKFYNIVNDLFDFYFEDIVNDYLDRFFNNQTIEICGVEINQTFVKLKFKKLIKTYTKEISWDNLKTRAYQTYYAIYSSENAADINKSYKFLDDYNTYVLQCVLETIIKTDNQKVKIT